MFPGGVYFTAGIHKTNHMTVKDIMTREVLTAKETDPIVDVARILSEGKIHAVPIVDDRGFLRGIIAESDFFTKGSPDGEIHLPSYIELLRKLKFPEAIGADDSEKVRSLLVAKAEDIMTRDCVTIGRDADVQSLLEMIRSTGYASIPVTDDDRRLVGIVTVHDALRELIPGRGAVADATHLSDRDIDAETGEGSSWIGDRFRIVKTCRVNAAVAFLIIAFFAGALSAIVFFSALDVFVYGN